MGSGKLHARSLCVSALTYADVCCWRMLTCADPSAGKRLMVCGKLHVRSVCVSAPRIPFLHTNMNESIFCRLVASV